MAKVRIQIHAEGFAEVRKSAGVVADLEARADRVVAAAGGDGDFSATTYTTGDRARVIVRTASSEGRRAEAEDRALTGALDAGRG